MIALSSSCALTGASTQTPGSGGTSPTVTDPPTTQPPRATTAPPVTATDLLDTLVVQGRGPKTGYARAAFGTGWVDTDRNGCDTRNDVLQRDLTAVALRPGTHDCVVVSGQLADPYTGGSTTFSKGDADAVQIDGEDVASTAATPPASSTEAPTAASTTADPDYGSCAMAIAAGAGPYRRGRPEYGYYEDRDGDGVVCER